MRPSVTFLDNQLLEQIITEARSLLCKLGLEIHNEQILSLLADHGAAIDLGKKHAFLTEDLIDRALHTAPSSFKLYNTLGEETHDLSGKQVHFTPGSAAISVLDGATQKVRKPLTSDYVDYAKLVSQMEYLASQSTALIPSDVHELMSDSYRLYLSLILGEKPVITGAFTIDSFQVMKELLVAARGSEAALREKPLAVFSVCPTSPLRWTHVSSQQLLDCARYHIPVEYVSMPLAGFIAPVTLVGTLVQHTAETLSGVVMTQLIQPGAPALYGGSPAIFDVRYETTPIGAIETEMLDCAYNEIGKCLGLPTQAYIGLSDAKQLDTQAGLETSMGATLAALSGINNISGAGMLDFQTCQSLEKLVVDNEICGMVLRMLKGIEPKEDFPSQPHLEELLREKHLLISDHTRRYLREEHYFPGPVIARANRQRWESEGSLTLRQRASAAVESHLTQYKPSRLSDDCKNELTVLMKKEAQKHGMESLPYVFV